MNEHQGWFESLVIFGPAGSEVCHGCDQPEKIYERARNCIDELEHSGKLLGYSSPVQVVVEGAGHGSYVGVREPRVLVLSGVSSAQAEFARKQLDGWCAGRPLELLTSRRGEPRDTADPADEGEGPKDSSSVADEEVLPVTVGPLAGRPIVPNVAAIQGNLRQFGVANVLEFLRLTRCSGTLVCRGLGQQAVLVLREGWLGSAVLCPIAEDVIPSQEPCLGMDSIVAVLVELVGWSQGHFRFEPEDVPKILEPEIVLYETQKLLLETYRQVDELVAQ